MSRQLIFSFVSKLLLLFSIIGFQASSAEQVTPTSANVSLESQILDSESRQTYHDFLESQKSANFDQRKQNFIKFKESLHRRIKAIVGERQENEVIKSPDFKLLVQIIEIQTFVELIQISNPSPAALQKSCENLQAQLNASTNPSENLPRPLILGNAIAQQILNSFCSIKK